MKELFKTYLQNSISLSVVGVLLQALSPLLSRRYSAKCRYTLWLIVMFAFIIPIHPQINIRMPEAIQPFFPENIMNLFNTVNKNDIPVITTVKTWDWWRAAAVLWAAGALCFLCWNAFHHFRFRGAVRRWSEEISSDKKNQFQNIKNEMGIRRHIAIRSCTCIRTPMMAGLMKPVILIPEIDLSTEEFSFILKHELVHYKRKDLYYKTLVMLALTIHWFNPVVHFMVRSVLNLCEISCDEEVLHGADSKVRAHYGETIISVIRKGKFYQTVLSTNFYSGSKGMKDRIFAIMDMKRKRFSILALFVASISTFCGISAFAMSIQSEQNMNTEQTVSAVSSPSRKTDGSPDFSTSLTNTAESAVNGNQNDNKLASNEIVSSAENSPQLVPKEQNKEGQSFYISRETNTMLVPY